MPESEDSTSSELIKAGVEVVKTAYDDALRPVAKETGKALGTLGKTINMALSPLAGLVWGYDQFQMFLESKVANKLEEVPVEEIITPKSSVAVPTLEALRYSGEEDDLAELYAGLLATAMTERLSKKAHPAFTGIIKSLSPDEAKILQIFKTNSSYPVVDIRTKLNTENIKLSEGINIPPGSFFISDKNISLLGIKAGCDYPDQTPAYLDNLARLGLLTFPSDHVLSNEVYSLLESSDTVNKARERAENRGMFTTFLKRKKVDLTSFGKQFIAACIRN